MKINEKLLEFLKLGKFEWNLNEWGSVQYSGALASFNAFNISKSGRKQKEHFQILKDSFGISILLGTTLCDELAMKCFTEKMEKRRNFDESMLNELTKLKDGNGMFKFCRSNSFDLWTAARIIAECYTPGMDIKISGSNSTGEERGPDGNMEAQRSNIITGIYCALLADRNNVDNVSFKGFDT